MKWITALVALILSLSSAWAVDEGPIKPRDTMPLVLPRNPINRPPPASVHLQMEKFFAQLQQAKVDDAFKDLFKDAEQLQKRYNAEEFISKTKQALLVYGSVAGFELYDNRALGSRMISLTYFVYLQSMPLRWRMVYYAADGQNWKLINLSVDDLLDQSALAE